MRGYPYPTEPFHCHCPLHIMAHQPFHHLPIDTPGTCILDSPQYLRWPMPPYLWKKVINQAFSPSLWRQLWQKNRYPPLHQLYTSSQLMDPPVPMVRESVRTGRVIVRSRECPFFPALTTTGRGIRGFRLPTIEIEGTCLNFLVSICVRLYYRCTFVLNIIFFQFSYLIIYTHVCVRAGESRFCRCRAVRPVRVCFK